MFELKADQKIFEIGGVKVGGAPGKDPTVLVGTLFYKRQKIVEDEEKGVFDREKAEAYIRLQEELSDVTGNPAMIDIEGSTEEAIRRYVDFVAGVSDAPIFLGGPTPEVRKAGLGIVEEMGLSGRVVYNSLMPGCGDGEVEAIRDSGVESAVLLAYNVTDLSSEGRLEALRGLVESTGRLGVSKPLLDTFVMDIPSLGTAFGAFLEAKSELGLPVGCGPHNAIGLWKGLRRKMGLKSKRSVVASVSSFATAMGADWILYGPIEAARVVFPSVAMVDAAFAFPAIQGGVRLDRGHPFFKIA